MRVLVLTGDQPRHQYLVAQLLRAGHEVVAYTIPRARPTPEGLAMAEYYLRLTDAEQAIFRARCRPVQVVNDVEAAVDWAQRILVFGYRYIREPLLGWLMAKGAMNIHAGIAPEYRGSACNFWADYHGRPDLVGVTLHDLTAEIDGGAIRRRILSDMWGGFDPWRRGLARLRDALELIAQEEIDAPSPAVPQDPAQHLHYSRHADFTEAVCAEYLARQAVEVPACR